MWLGSLVLLSDGVHAFTGMFALRQFARMPFVNYALIAVNFLVFL